MIALTEIKENIINLKGEGEGERKVQRRGDERGDKKAKPIFFPCFDCVMKFLFNTETLGKREDKRSRRERIDRK